MTKDTNPEVNVVFNPDNAKMNVPLPKGISNDPDVAARQKVHEMTKAAVQGQLPTNSQATAALNKAISSDALHEAKKDLSATGSTIAADVQKVLQDTKQFIVEKNKGDTIQDFIYHAQNAAKRNQPIVAGSAQRLAGKSEGIVPPKEQLKEAAQRVYEVGRLLTTNAEFRALLLDAKNILQSVLTGVLNETAEKSKNQAPDAAKAIKENTGRLNQAIDSATKQMDQSGSIDPKKTAQDAGVDVPASEKEVKEKASKAADKAQGKAEETMGAAENKVNEEARDKRSKLANELGNLDKPLTEVAKSFKPEAEQALNKGQEMAGDAMNKGKEVANEANKQGTVVAQNLKESVQNVQISEEDQNKLLDRLKNLIKSIQEHPQFQDAVDYILSLFSTVADTTTQIAQEATQEASTVVADPDVKAAQHDVRKLLENFAQGKSFDKLLGYMEELHKKAECDQKLKQLVSDFNSFVLGSIREPEVINDNDWYKHAKAIAREAQKVFEKHDYKALLQGIFDEVTDFLRRISDDKVTKTLASDLEKLAKDIFLDESGQPTFKPELLRDAQIIIPRLAEELKFIPLPRIEYMDEDYDIVIDNLVLTAENIIPKHIRIATKTEIDSRSGKDVAEMLMQIKVEHIHLEAKDAKFYYCKKSGFPKMSDRGFLTFSVGEGDKDGLSLDIVAGPDLSKNDRAILIKRVEAKMDGVHIKIHDSKHDFLYKMLMPFMKSTIKSKVEKAIEDNVKGFIVTLDENAQVLKSEAMQKLEPARDEPPRANPIWGSEAYTPVGTK